jgi:hypothetical protein
MALKRFHTVFQGLRALEIQIVGSLFHSSAVTPDYIVYATAEQVYDFIHHRPVFLKRYSAIAAAMTAADLQIQARADPAPEDGVCIYPVPAAPQGIIDPEKIQQSAGMHDGTVGPEVAGAVPDHPSGQEDSRKRLGAHAYPGISFGILQEYVVTRFVAFDEVILKQKCIGFTVYDRILYIRDF